MNLIRKNINDIELVDRYYLCRIFGTWAAGTFTMTAFGFKMFTGFGESLAPLEWIEEIYEIPARQATSQ